MGKKLDVTQQCPAAQKTNPNPQPGEEKAARQFSKGLPVSEEVYKRTGERVLKRTCSDGTSPFVVIPA